MHLSAVGHADTPQIASAHAHTSDVQKFKKWLFCHGLCMCVCVYVGERERGLLVPKAAAQGRIGVDSERAQQAAWAMEH